jgi:hypothetical protein
MKPIDQAVSEALRSLEEYRRLHEVHRALLSELHTLLFRVDALLEKGESQ